ncbi:MAG TPA: septation protein SepH, partial [Acidimicrobiales bacterium]|nr:septation protein SepH [Acidimicrobiales bacterium]
MQKLHLVGTTTDSAGLILSARRGARSGSYTLVLDDALAEAVEELRARQEEDAATDGRSGRTARTESRLPIGEIQARLRRGKTVKDVAKDAGVDPEWIERFAAPVFAEQAETIAKVQGTFLKRARLGPSGMRIGDAVRRNLAERAVVMSPDEYTRAWTTHQRPDGRWLVRFAFHYRGNAKTLKYEVRPGGEVSATDSFTSQMSYVAPPKRATPKPKPLPEAADTSAKRAVVSTGFRPDSPAKPTSRPAKERERATAIMDKAAQKRAAEGEKAAARKARERSRMLAQREREARI